MPRRKPPHRARCQFEMLEDRRLLAYFYWDPLPGVAGRWEDPANWRTDSTPRHERTLVPSSNDSVFIVAEDEDLPELKVLVNSAAQAASISIGPATEFGETRSPVRIEGDGTLTVERLTGKQITVNGTDITATEFEVEQITTLGEVEIVGSKGRIDHGTLSQKTSAKLRDSLGLTNKVEIFGKVTIAGGPLGKSGTVIVRPGGHLELLDVMLHVDEVIVDSVPEDSELTPGTIGGIPEVPDGNPLFYGASGTIFGDLRNDGTGYFNSLTIDGDYHHGADAVAKINFTAFRGQPIPVLGLLPLSVEAADLKGGELHLDHVPPWLGAESEDVEIVGSKGRIDHGTLSQKTSAKLDGRVDLISVKLLTGQFEKVTWNSLNYGYDNQPVVGPNEEYQSPDLFPALHYNRRKQAIEVLFSETPRVGNFQSMLNHDFPKGALDDQMTKEKAKSNLILIMHGSANSAQEGSWSMNFAHKLRGKLDSEGKYDDWDVALFDWSRFSTGVDRDLVNGKDDWRPWTASNQAISLGDGLSQWMVAKGLTKYENIHVFSHSAGSWGADAFVDGIHKRFHPTPFTHLTLFDAFAPEPGFRQNAARALFNERGVDIESWGKTESPVLGDTAIFGEHYVDRRQFRFYDDRSLPTSAVEFTDAELEKFVEIDVTRFHPIDRSLIYTLHDPDVFDPNNKVRLRSHSWPYEFYLLTIEGQHSSMFGYGLSLESGRPAAPDQLRGSRYRLAEDGSAALLRAGEWVAVPVIAQSVSSPTPGAIEIGPAGHLRISAAAGQEVTAVLQFRTTESISRLELLTSLAAGNMAAVRLFLDNEELSELLKEQAFPAAESTTLDFDTLPAGLHELKIVINAGSDAPASVAIANLRVSAVEVLTSVPSWQNPVRRLDVNLDGRVTALDALRIINFLGRRAASRVPVTDIGASPPDFYDVNGDGYVSALDALNVVNQLLYIDNQVSGLVASAVPSSFVSSPSVGLPVRNLEMVVEEDRVLQDGITENQFDSSDRILTAGFEISTGSAENAIESVVLYDADSSTAEDTDAALTALLVELSDLSEI